MQSALEQEVSLLLERARSWLRDRDRAVVIGMLLCCVPFLPVTMVGLLVTLANILLVVFRRLPRAELPLLVLGVVIAVLYAIGWWLLFRTVRASGLWLWHGWWSQWPIWQWLHAIAPHPPSHSAQTI